MPDFCLDSVLLKVSHTPQNGHLLFENVEFFLYGLNKDLIQSIQKMLFDLTCEKD